MINLRIVYLKLYSNEPYFWKFDQGVLNTISANYGDLVKIDYDNRTIESQNYKYSLHSLSWVFGEKLVDLKTVTKINSQPEKNSPIS